MVVFILFHGQCTLIPSNRYLMLGKNSHVYLKHERQPNILNFEWEPLGNIFSEHFSKWATNMGKTNQSGSVERWVTSESAPPSAPRNHLPYLPLAVALGCSVTCFFSKWLHPWKLTWQAGKSPFSIGNTSTHSWWIFHCHASFWGVT